MSIFNPYGNRTLLSIYRERFMIFRIYILLIGVLSFVNCAFIILNINVCIFYSAYVPPLLTRLGTALLQNNRNFFGMILCMGSIVTVLFYVMAYILSAKKYCYAVGAVILFAIDSAVMLIDIENAGLWYIMGHILICVLLTWGIITTKRLADEERRDEK